VDSSVAWKSEKSATFRPCADCGLPSFSYQDVSLQRTGFSIRLVKLHPARTADADIVLDLITNEDSQLAYEAVSWCWGKGGWSSSIRVRCNSGDKCLKVSANLESALRHLRLTDTFRILWIDAININQSDSSEKSRQVPMMSEIYGKAQRVCVWLGDEDDSSVKAINFIKEDVLNLQNFDNLCVDEFYAESWMALIRFMERPWVSLDMFKPCHTERLIRVQNMQFSRRWVVQEISLADQKAATIVCGGDSITWAEFAEAVSLFDGALTGPLNLSRLKVPQLDNVSYSIRYAPALSAIRLVKAANELFRASYYQGRPFPLRSLEYMVSTFTMYETSEPRDVIFALLSISKDAFRLDEPPGGEMTDIQYTVFDHLPTAQRVVKSWIEKHIIRQAFKVDYDTPVLEVYKQFISFSVSKADPSRALDIICRPWAPELQDIEFPSWISTLANAAYMLVDQNAMGKRLVRRNPDPLVGTPDLANYNASRNLGPPKERHIFKYWNSVDRSMFLRGFILDEVGALEFPSQLGHIPREWPIMGGWDPKFGPPSEEFWRTLVADRGPDGRDPLPFYPRACKHIFQHAIDDTLDTSILINHGSSVIADFLKRVQAVIWNRRLMRTKRSWLGLAPKGARPDDLICILYGCSVPVVLRRVRKSQQDLETELRDEEARKANAAEYIARMIAAAARRRRNARAQVRADAQYTVNYTADQHQILDQPLSQDPQKFSGNPSDLTPASKSHPCKLVTEASLSRELKRQSSEADHEGPASKRIAPLLKASRETEISGTFYYVLVGECYVHGMMNGEAISFRSRYNPGKPIEDRILPQTFELR